MEHQGDEIEIKIEIGSRRTIPKESRTSGVIGR
jgi:hypothetical protein